MLCARVGTFTEGPMTEIGIAGPGKPVGEKT